MALSECDGRSSQLSLIASAPVIFKPTSKFSHAQEITPMASSTLPASRFDAISVCGVSLSSALIGATPGKSQYVALALAGGGNLWAIASSVFTFKDLLDDDTVETHLRFFVMVLLVQTIISSSLALLAFTFPTKVDSFVYLAGLSSSSVSLICGLGALTFAFFQGCKPSTPFDFDNSEFCAHTTKVALIVLGGAFVACCFLAWFLWAIADRYPDSAAGALPTCCFPSLVVDTSNRSRYPEHQEAAVHYADYSEADASFRRSRSRRPSQAVAEGAKTPPHALPSALATRMSALVKACLLGAYWFFVDGALTHDAFTFEDYDVTSWVTGQYAKHGVAILNNIFNYLPC